MGFVSFSQAQDIFLFLYTSSLLCGNQKSYHTERVIAESLVLIYSPIKPSRYTVVISLLWGQVEIFVMAS